MYNKKWSKPESPPCFDFPHAGTEASGPSDSDTTTFGTINLHHQKQKVQAGTPDTPEQMTTPLI